MAESKEKKESKGKEKKEVKKEITREILAKAIILSYRGGKSTQNTRQLLIKVKGIESKEEAKKFLGKRLIVKLKKKEMIGRITRLHGGKGVLRVQFSKGLPGQVIGKEAYVIE